ncbi:type VI secretion system tip protein TssI/VgrG [Desulfococcaceae bacterium HSG9]|nr:type VI secretion system tip protein TssI/VgrG [Desulfococcaceae bacterium HSG9]
MDFKERKRFLFVSEALPPDTFSVVRFEGFEVMSSLYEFDITLVSNNNSIILKEVIRNPAVFKILRDYDDYPIYGIVAEFEQLHEVNEFTFYRAVLVPKLWWADIYQSNQLFLDKTAPQVIDEVLKQSELTTLDYEIKTGSYPQWEYICQYGETNFNFMSRWMEREGMYYYFDHQENSDNKSEKLIITDHYAAHEDIPDEMLLSYSPPSALLPEEKEVIITLTCRQKLLPRKVILKDYNYRTPSLEIKGEAKVDDEGHGDVYIYGEHFKDSGQGNALAKIRAEERLCRQLIFYGESTVPTLRSGYIFELKDHYRPEYNQRYLITEVRHKGNQSGYILSGLDIKENASKKDASEPEEKHGYENSFTAIPADVQFRPEKKTPQVRFNGTMNAKVDASGSGQYAEIDEQGRYKLKLPFDRSESQGGKASRWVRMAQPYAGSDYGMHFPLHKGIDVLLTFIDGDPDRPVISGSVPNPETVSPITDKNLTKSMMRSCGQNELHFDDLKGEENIFLYGTKDWTIDITNDKKQTIGHDETMDVGNNRTKSVGVDQKETIGENKSIDVGKNHTESIKDNAKITIGKDKTISIGKNLSESVKDDAKITIGKDETISIGKNLSASIGSTASIDVTKEATTKIGKNMGLDVGKKLNVHAADQINFFSDKQIVLKAGKASIALKKNGDVIIKGSKMNIKASGDIKIKGSKIGEN